MRAHPGFGVKTITLLAVFALLAVAVRADDRSSAKPAGNGLGTIAGTVTFKGEVPPHRVIDDAGQRRALLEVDRKTHGLRYAVAYLLTKSTSERPPKQAGDAQPRKPTVIDQVEHTFVPHVVAVRSGDTVKFTNSDTANHNVRGSSINSKNEFNIFTGAGGDHSQKFYSDRNRPVRLGCDIHPWMGAWVYAFDHPYYALTDARGRFRIANVPPGTHELIVRQPDGGLSRQQTVMVVAGEVNQLELEFSSDDLKGL